jgi:hypothetical protein
VRGLPEGIFDGEGHGRDRDLETWEAIMPIESDVRIVKAILAVGVPQVLTQPGAPELKRAETRTHALETAAAVAEGLFEVLFTKK